MSPARRALRQTLTIARRDFIATVFTPVFLLFLFAPALIGTMSAVGGVGAASMSDGAADRSRIVAIVAARDADPLRRQDQRLRHLFRPDDAPAPLAVTIATADPAAQARAALSGGRVDVHAVLYGPLDRPTILVPPQTRYADAYLEALAQATVAAARPDAVTVRAARIAVRPPEHSAGGQHQSGFIAVFGIFFLTLFLAGQVVGTMAEERNNKVIEVLAAAVPLEAVFAGKLIGMFGVAVLFITFWGTVLGQILSLVPGDMAAGLGALAPAVGTPVFVMLFAAYFSMAYLLLGSVFLGVGAQASTMREIQMLSLPITLVQVGMFALASAAARQPGSVLAMVAEIFPLSSPFAMAGRAANSPEVWPHLLALGWQAIWVAAFIAAGARLFRRGVLQSGGGRPFWRRRRAPI